MSLAFYAAIGAALFPIPAGQKNPLGIVASFAKDCSTDPEVWAKWLAAHPGCNWGIVAGSSGLIIIDIDVVKQGRDAAWSAWCALCASWGLPGPLAPHVQSARGGWHVYMAVPDGVDARSLRAPDYDHGLIEVKAGNGYVVAAGSYYDGTAKGETSGPYVLFNAEMRPHPAPVALVEHCTRRLEGLKSGAGAKVGEWDPGDVAELLRWLAEPEREAFANYEDWLSIGMALKVEFGDAGRDLWALTFDGSVTADVEITKWESFSENPRPGDVTLQSWFARAHALGWRGQVRRAGEEMFGDAVASIAAAAGATLPGPGPENETALLTQNSRLGAVPSPSNSTTGRVAALTGGTDELHRRGVDRCREFLAATADEPSRPRGAECPTLPEHLAGETFYGPLNDAICRALAMAEGGRAGLGTRAVAVLAYLAHVDREIAGAVVRRCNALGASIAEARVWQAAESLAMDVHRHFTGAQAHDFYRDVKGFPERDNSDNVAIFLNMIEAEVRWNAWLERVEIRGWKFRDWTHVTDDVVSQMRSRGNRTEMRFVPAKDFLWDSLIAIARANTVDPALDTLAAAQAAWDGLPRLEMWLSVVCGVPADNYHRAVARHIIGGMVRRIRQPGCKHDEMAVLCGPQGTGKSSLAAALAMRPEWFTDATHLDEESKELILLLSGVCMAEISEMTTRSGQIQKIKAQISKQTDKGRPAYGRAVLTRPRRNIFIGSTNLETPLIDTENRRFFPVMVMQEMRLDWLRAALWQLIGEAAHYEAAGETFAMPREVWADARAMQEAARGESAIDIQLGDWFAQNQFTGEWQYITAKDLADMVQLSGWRGGTQTLSDGMQRLGFRRELIYIEGKKTRTWVRGPNAQPHIVLQNGTRYLIDKNNIGQILARPRTGAAPAAGSNVLPMIPKR